MTGVEAAAAAMVAHLARQLATQIASDKALLTAVRAAKATS